MPRALIAVLAVLALVPLSAFAAPAARQTTDVAIVSLDFETGGRVAGACYLIIGGSIEGCDENGDGQVDFAGVPNGRYEVTQTRAPAGYRPLANFEITVGVGAATAGIFPVYLAPDRGNPPAASTGTADVAIVSLDAQTGERLTGACYIINGASIEGCDENADGQVDYEDVALGRWVVSQTRTPAGYAAYDDFEIEVRDNGAAVFNAVLTPLNRGGPGRTVPSSRTGTADVAIVSADIETGQRVAGACYVINDASIEGCDENADGQVDFAGVALGRFTVTQTRAPAGYLPVGDFPIAIIHNGAAIFAAFIAEETGGGATVDIAVEAFDPSANRAVPGACFLLYGGSIEGCDENGDGRVDFEDVRVGTYLVTETRAPANYGVPDDAWFAVTSTGATILVVLQVPRR